MGKTKHITDIVMFPSLKASDLWHNGITPTRCGREIPLDNSVNLEENSIIYSSFDRDSLLRPVTCPLCLTAIDEKRTIQYVYEVEVQHAASADRGTITLLLRNDICRDDTKSRGEIIYKILLLEGESEYFRRISRIVDDCILCTLGWQHTTCQPAVHKFFKPGAVITEVNMEHIF